PCAGHHRHRPSVPTRRSSDLTGVVTPRLTAGANSPLATRSSVANCRHESNRSAGFLFRASKSTARAAAPIPGLNVDSGGGALLADRKSTRLNSSHLGISYAVF